MRNDSLADVYDTDNNGAGTDATATPVHTTFLTVQTDRLPAALSARRQWVAWKAGRDPKGRPTKQPINPDTGKFADTTAPSSWGTLAEALARMRTDHLAGVGFVFAPTD